MHLCNPYRNKPPNFVELGKKCHELVPFLKKNGSLKFEEDSDCNRILSISLLKCDFDLNVNIPKGHLVPTIPNRLDYLYWIRDLIGGRGEKQRKGEKNSIENDNFNQRIIILDIGTGASCIYPLLGTRVFNDKEALFYGTDSNLTSIEIATENVQRNNLEDRIKLFHVDKNEFIPKRIFDLMPNDEIDALICNPPFYSSIQEMENGSKIKGMSLPLSKNEMTFSNEFIYENGGDLGFAKAIFSDSLYYQTRIRWYSVMFGKKASFTQFLQLLREFNGKGSLSDLSYNSSISNNLDSIPSSILIKSKSFQQGETKRWFISWSFLGRNKKIKKIYNIDINQFIDKLMELDGVIRIDQDTFMITRPSWTRKFKRIKLKKEQENNQVKNLKRDSENIQGTILNIELKIYKEYDSIIIELKDENYWNDLQVLLKFLFLSFSKKEGKGKRG